MSTNKLFLPYSMMQMLMDVETLLLTTTNPHLRIWPAKLYPLTLSLSFSPSLDYLRYGTLLNNIPIHLARQPLSLPLLLYPTANAYIDTDKMAIVPTVN